MSENNNQDPTVNKTADNEADKTLVDKLVEERVAEALKPIKSKLDSAFEARDAALKKAAEYEEKERQAELKRLQEEGKHKEAYEMQLAEERAKREVAEKRNVELTRDLEVKNTLSGIDFRSTKANEMAYREIVGQLVQNEQGQWVHRSGVTVQEFINSYIADESNAFLLKPKASSGTGGTSVKTQTPPAGNKSLFAMTQDEVLKMAQEGKLRR